MKTGSSKIQPIHATLVIKMFILLNKLHKVGMSFLGLFPCDLALHYNMDAMNKFAKVFLMLLGENSSKKARAKAK